MAIASPASENRLIVWPNSVSGSAVNSVPSRSTQIGATDARTFLERDADDENDDEQLVDDGLKEVRERVPDEGCAIVGRDELDARGKRRLQARAFPRSALVTASTLRPCSMMAMPPTTSPVPSRSAMPRRRS